MMVQIFEIWLLVILNQLIIKSGIVIRYKIKKKKKYPNSTNKSKVFIKEIKN